MASERGGDDGGGGGARRGAVRRHRRRSRHRLHRGDVGEPALADKPLYLADGSKTDTLLDAGLPAASQTIIFTNSVGTVAAAPAGAAFDLFQSRYQSEFGKDRQLRFHRQRLRRRVRRRGRRGVRRAERQQQLRRSHGRQRPVAPGERDEAEASGIGWSAIKNGLTSGDRNVDIVGVSGPLDFDVSTGQAPAAIEIRKPSQDMVTCAAQGDSPPCITRLAVGQPTPNCRPGWHTRAHGIQEDPGCVSAEGPDFSSTGARSSTARTPRAPNRSARASRGPPRATSPSRLAFRTSATWWRITPTTTRRTSRSSRRTSSPRRTPSTSRPRLR